MADLNLFENDPNWMEPRHAAATGFVLPSDFEFPYEVYDPQAFGGEDAEDAKRHNRAAKEFAQRSGRAFAAKWGEGAYKLFVEAPATPPLLVFDKPNLVAARIVPVRHLTGNNNAPSFPSGTEQFVYRMQAAYPYLSMPDTDHEKLWMDIETHFVGHQRSGEGARRTMYDRRIFVPFDKLVGKYARLMRTLRPTPDSGSMATGYPGWKRVVEDTTASYDPPPIKYSMTLPSRGAGRYFPENLHENWESCGDDRTFGCAEVYEDVKLDYIQPWRAGEIANAEDKLFGKWTDGTVAYYVLDKDSLVAMCKSAGGVD
ncbi:hypothetical protein LTR49_027005 [Elasticomyces elasticus]|nr:hypothetical protein LTR49_027005 [Elasticomyces elasticus]